ncbi:hypothetical protein K438DRAFT_1803927 [Mycena galopus ATCC 62051]|nr:hypothetical protein K438DRAFT_1803927 [Mycena galopus ATCC 62051]
MKIKKINRDASGGTSTAAAGGSGTARVRTAPPPPRPPPPPEKDPLFDSPGKDPLFDAPEDNEPLNQVESPVDMFGDANEQSILPPALSRRKSAQAAQTDEWLSANGPPQMAAPLAPAVDPPIAARLGVKPKIISHLKPIPKKWKWSGKLFMDVTDPKDAPPRTDHLCNVVLNELFPTTVEGPQINVVMGSREALRLLSFHDLVDMSEFLKTSGVRMSATLPLQQLARLGPAAEADEKPLKTLARYMTKKNFISLVPTYFDGDLVGHLLLFPPVMSVLCRMLKVPPEMLQNSALIVALLPWKPFPQESRRPFGLLAPPTKPRVPSESDWKKNMTKAKYQLGLRILKFPPELHAWFARTSKTYCVWPPSEERRGNRERETVYLMAVLKECGAKKVKVGIKADLRAVFVHVGALGSIHRMPLLVERRSQTCGIRFYTFGTHESVHPEYWGVREVYPLGGVVTFTASALYEDPWGIVDKMKAINKHPLWTCYILPSVFGLATKLCHLEEDPLAAFDRDEFVFDRLLRAIDDGEVSVLRAPPLERNATRSNDPAADWLREHWINRPPGPRQMLESCLSAFSAKYSNTPRAGWASAVEAEVSADLDLMQVQPDIMKQYRRYVVIKAETDSHLAGDKDGFEWLSSSTFSFCDEFLSSPQKTAGVS